MPGYRNEVGGIPDELAAEREALGGVELGGVELLPEVAQRKLGEGDAREIERVAEENLEPVRAAIEKAADDLLVILAHVERRFDERRRAGNPLVARAAPQLELEAVAVVDC